jgi:hypothetical protein
VHMSANASETSTTHICHAAFTGLQSPRRHQTIRLGSCAWTYKGVELSPGELQSTSLVGRALPLSCILPSS